MEIGKAILASFREQESGNQKGSKTHNYVSAFKFLTVYWNLLLVVNIASTKYLEKLKYSKITPERNYSDESNGMAFIVEPDRSTPCGWSRSRAWRGRGGAETNA